MRFRKPCASACGRSAKGGSALALALALALAACEPTIKVQLPQEPIRLSVDVNIRHEVKVSIEHEVDRLQAGPAIPAAKRAGWLGERLDGYLGLVAAEVPSEVRDLATRANEERLGEYDRLAERLQADRATVEQVAGNRLIERSQSGDFVQDDNRRWMKKP